MAYKCTSNRARNRDHILDGSCQAFTDPKIFQFIAIQNELHSKETHHYHTFLLNRGKQFEKTIAYPKVDVKTLTYAKNAQN